MAASITYLSPHLDDAVLSCGGLISKQALSGQQVTVTTVFAGQPVACQISEYAASLHALWGSGAETVSERRREDRAAMESLGVTAGHLEYLDAIYRSDGNRFLYVSDQDLFGHRHESETMLIGELAESITRLVSLLDSWVYAPLGVGNHVDHQLVACVGMRLLQHTDRVIFYEDYPYAERPGALTRRLQGVGQIGWRPQIEALPPECMQAKIDAISSYQSQLSSLFGDADKVKRRVTAYALAICPADGMAERYWHSLPRGMQDLQYEGR